MSINITAKEFQRRMIGAANRHHAAMQGMTDNEAASYVRASSRPRCRRIRRLRTRLGSTAFPKIETAPGRDVTVRAA